MAHHEKTFNLNVEIKDLPQSINHTLNTIAALQGKFKWEVIRDALIFYAESKGKEIPKFAGLGVSKG